MLDVVALGEALIDFTPLPAGPNGNPAFEMNPGGAPANCLAALCAQGGSGAIIGMVGRDNFGDFLEEKLKGAGVCTRGLSRSDVHTTLAFVQLDGMGERKFDFLRKPGADIMLREEQVDTALIDQAKIFHFGSLALTDEPLRSACIYALEYAKAKGIPVSYDPNYRPPLWSSREEAAEMMALGLSYADIVKMSEEEMAILTGLPETEYERGAEAVFDWGKQAVFVTLGRSGAYYITRRGRGFVPGFPVDAVDTTGCGDAFTGTVLYFLTHRPDASPEEMVRAACAAGALCATKRGGIPAMPGLEDVLKLAF